MGISSNIDEVISFLKCKQKEGYKTVELIDDARVSGWYQLNPMIPFISCKQEPTVLGIDIRQNKKWSDNDE